MARIGIFGLNLSAKSGGVYSLVRNLLASAAASRHELLYVGEGPVDRPLPANVRVVEASSRRRVMVQALFRLLRSDRALSDRDRARRTLGMLSGLGAGLFAQVDAWLWPHGFAPVPNLGPMVVFCHDRIHRHEAGLFSAAALARRAAGERSLARCAAIACPSSATRDDLLADYPDLAGRTRVTPLAASPGPASQACQALRRELRRRLGPARLFLYVAVDWPHKNHQLLVQAAGLAASLTPEPFEVVFVGHRRGGRLGRIIRRAGLGRIVTDVGGVSREMLGAYYGEADALLFPSRVEGFGLPLVEAMQAGLPIVASDRSSIPEVCGSCAVLLSPDEPEAWAREMLRLLGDGDHRRELAQRSRQRAEAFSWPRTWQALDDLLDQAAADTAAGAAVDAL